MRGLFGQQEEYGLSEIATYVNRVTLVLVERGVAAAEVQRLIDGYGQFIFDAYLDGMEVQTVAAEFVAMAGQRMPMSRPRVSLYGLSRYVALIIVDLVSFSFDPLDAIDVVDDSSQTVVKWYGHGLVEPRAAARRLAANERQLEAGHAMLDAG